MRIKLTENQLQRYLLAEITNGLVSDESDYNLVADGNSEHNPYSKQIKNGIEILQKFVFNNGRVMTNIDNGKDYIVFEILQLATLTGKRFCLCQLYKDNEPFGAIYVKPFSLFREKH